MLQALGVLGGVYEGWQQGKEAQRRRRLQDLQAESYELRNEGYRLSNKYDETTFDDRVGTVNATRRKTDFQAEQERIAALVDAEIAPYLVHEAEFDARTSEQGFYTERNKTAKEGANADKAQTEARVSANTADARVQGTVAEQQQKVRELTADHMDAVADVFEATNGDWNSVFDHVGARASLVAISRRATGENVTDFEQLEDGNIAIWGEDEAEPAFVVSEAEFGSLVTDPEELASMMQTTAQHQSVESMREEDAADLRLSAGQAASEVGQAANDAEARAPVSGEVSRVLSDLSEQRSGIQSQIEALEAEAQGGNMGSRRNNRQGTGNAPTLFNLSSSSDGSRRGNRHGGVDRSVETETPQLVADDSASKTLASLRDELRRTDEAISTFEDQHAETLQHSPEGWRGQANVLRDEVVPDVITQYDRDSQALQDRNNSIDGAALLTGNTPFEAESNARGLGSLPGEHSPTEQREQDLADATTSQGINKIVMAGVEEAVDDLSTDDNIHPDRLNSARESVMAAIQASSRDDNNNLYRALYSGDPKQHFDAMSLVKLAVSAHAEGSTDANAFINGSLRNWSVAGIEAASDMLAEESLAGLTSDMRIRAATAVVDLIERGESPTDAKTQVLNEVNSTRQ